MSRGVTLRTVIAVILFTGGCAPRGPIFQDSDIRFAPPPNEACSGTTQQPSLTISVLDAQGGAINGVAAYLAHVTQEVPVAVGRTDERGQAILTAPGSGDYAITAVVQGFLPQVKAVHLKDGCTGSLAFVLALGPLRHE
jgi:hypothetical protein